MYRARALVFPSRWYEGQPLVSMEALSIGLPVILAKWNAGSEQVEHHETGLIYSDVRDMPTMLKSMNTDMALRLSKKAYAKRNQYGLSIEDHITTLESIYYNISVRRN